jgi:hypothetical protein
MPARQRSPSSRPRGGRGSDGGARLVEVEDPSVQPAVLVEVAAGDLEPSRGLDTASLDRLKAGGADQASSSRPGNLVVGRIERTRRGARSASAASD